MKKLLTFLAIAAGTGPGVRPAAVEIRTFQFHDARLDVPVGTTVTWANRDAIAHTITSGAPDSADGAFDGTLADSGATFSHTFDRPGSYPYFCERHHFMRGEIRVLPSTGES